MILRSAWLLLWFVLPAWAGGPPRGKFQCLRYPPQSTASPYGDPVAYIWLRPHGVYDLLDLTTTKGKTSGRYAYDRGKQETDWSSGDLAKYVGHDLPAVEAVRAIRLNTKKDPDGRVDGTLRCLRVSD